MLLLPDGNGEFTDGDGHARRQDATSNFGKRSWRYSMLVRDKTIEKMFIEPQKPGDPFEVSDADTMLALHRSERASADQVAILDARGLLVLRRRPRSCWPRPGYDYAEIPLPHTIRTQGARRDRRAQTVPQVFVNGKLIGGSEELQKFLSERNRRNPANPG